MDAGGQGECGTRGEIRTDIDALPRAKLLVGNCGAAQGISSELCDGLGGGVGWGWE